MSLHNRDLKGTRPRLPSPQPSFARAITIPSARGSPASTSSHLGRNGSLTSTPEGMVPLTSCSLPAVPSYMLPESVLQPSMTTAPTSSPSAMAEALSRGPGLIRRVSRGAQGLNNKFRRNGTAAQRDKSSGPLIMRRRSNSKTAVEGAMDLSDLDLNYFDEDEGDVAVDEDGDPIVDALGITSLRPMASSIPSTAVSAPKRNSRVEQGTQLLKVSKKNKKNIILRLDMDSAKVFWDPSRHAKSFYIDDVKDLRTGVDAKHYREELGYDERYEPLWLTIVYSDTSHSRGKTKTMHLIAPDPFVFNTWTETLNAVSRNRIDIMTGLMGFAEKSAQLVWEREMKKRFHGREHLPAEATLDLQGIIELCRSLHINCSKETLHEYFVRADKDQTNSLNQEEFFDFIKQLKMRNDIELLYKQFTPDGAEMDQHTFFEFLQREQGVDVSADTEFWSSVFEKMAVQFSKGRSTPSDGGQIPLPVTWNLLAFQTFLSSDKYNPIYQPRSSTIKLDRPLNEYFISSSHNTYLLGHQVRGTSSTEAYISALQKGCRCLEIDCWDGSDGKPTVTHGRTLTKSISFLDVIKVIDKYAFMESQYPLLLSLEVHCSPDQQVSMVKTMIEEFGDKLVVHPLKDGYQLPSPEELKGRILIKVKGPPEALDTKALTHELTTRKRERSFSSPWSRPVQLNDNVIPNSPLVSSPRSLSPPERTNTFWASPRTSATSTTYYATPSFVSSADESDSPHVTATEDQDRKKSKRAKTSNITDVLGRLGVYTRGIKFTDFDAADAGTPNHVISVNENTFDKLTKPGAREKQRLEEHNMLSLMRVYPSARRILSSNFDPLRFWRRGVQMAATNWQTYDLGQQLNEAMFAGGDDRNGYVLKPRELRHHDQTPVVGPRRAPKMEVKFTVQIISAQQLPRLKTNADVNPFVQFEMYCAEDAGPNATGIGGQDVSTHKDGYSGIGQPLMKRTRIAPKGNGYNPEFRDEIEMTVTTRFPDLVFVRWTVWNTTEGKPDNAPLGQFTAKLNSLQQGYRHIPLFDSNGDQYLFSRLFCKIKKQDVVSASSLSALAGHSRRASVEPMSSLSDPPTTRSNSGNLFKRLIRAPSERKKRKEERSNGDWKDQDWEIISRSSTVER
ncbi:1-phosphatidylinositol-4,5-bisphosphate phosphodiesterase 1 [Bimuria novae-zelandiae CBS 107.79]|uniref:Phosphoinositide phospholipase C n=1 Tax=Bimuria novae-zelandiae CBS 107.79 TaxID=1447943 RepID=A0A6A5UTX6_9PLEO|nr:1-phosphatidylinositol-4,5-bisphosphate phosphodiesterase 1 [Bimuria novae-zelandiae CBS 107.79]